MKTTTPLIPLSRRRALANFIWWLLVAVVATGSLIPRSSPEFEAIGDLSHDALHAGCYAVLSGSRALYETKRRIPVIVLFCFALGLGLEFVQPLTGRLAESRDVLANTAGLILGLILARGARFIAAICYRRRGEP